MLRLRSILKVRNFKLSYTDIPKSKKYDQYREEIRAEIKKEFGEWLQSQVDSNKNPSYRRMRAKNKQITRQILKEYR